MKVSKIIALIVGILFGIASLLTAAFTVKLSFENKDALPQLIGPAEDARNVVEQIMVALDQQDYQTVSSLMVGNPDLGMDQEPADEVGKLFWTAYVQSFRYEMVGECYVTKDGLAQMVRISYMDLNEATEPLREASRTLLQERVANAKDASEVYNEAGEYREDVVMEVLQEAAEQVLQREFSQKTTELTVNLEFRDGRWQAIFDDAMLKALMGGITG